ncbi:T9SS-dependent choice-of-anchor J family protein [Chryseobacterium turcicum]|uniref:Choice-of-anchor J domain-containing protein n=1 Tax=Chryseobacterium turcicum TaxID=2898076 RepID=A0A9Q3V4D1_9FLAO|nr:choice-of-anchor J domain-containing protein [Chryseobacterium turcicum]MCD1117036.1 choice-of-anchor J domain-containing protein [Chryseobacterium turcicum]
MGLGLLNAQSTLFQENWDGQGPGISSWTLHNVDGLTPIAASAASNDGLPALVTNAWNVLSLTQIKNSGASSYLTFAYPPAATGMAGNVAVVNSWYNPAGVANDWLVSPQINIPAAATGVNLTWSATSLGAASYLENYKVYISTTGNQVANFTTILKTVTDESSSGTYHTVNLNSYIGQNVYIAFRDDSNDEYIMLLDNIKVTSTNTLATADIAKKQTYFSPNPTRDFLNIKTDSKINSVSVVDITGKKVNVKLENDKVDVRSLPAGTYLINVETKDGITTEKFIKK